MYDGSFVGIYVQRGWYATRSFVSLDGLGICNVDKNEIDGMALVPQLLENCWVLGPALVGFPLGILEVPRLKD